MIRLLTLLIAYPLLAQTPEHTLRALNLFSEAFRKIRMHAIATLSDQQLIEAAIQGMAHAVDAKSVFLDAPTYTKHKPHLQNAFAGVGIELRAQQQENKTQFIITHILPDSPAKQHTIRIGDILTHINGDSLDTYRLEDVLALLQGEVGETITLTVRQGGSTSAPSRVLPVIKDTLTVNPPEYRQFQDIGLLTIPIFQGYGVAKKIQTILTRAAQKAPLRALIIDLRNNPGGLLEQAIDICNLFLEKGTLITTVKGRAVTDAKEYRAGSGIILRNVPLYILLNRQTASAAEVMASALKDNKRAILIGERTFGKGTIQTTIPMRDMTALTLTTHQYITPNGVTITNRGLSPDMEWSHINDTLSFPQLIHCIETHKELFPNPPPKRALSS